MIAALAATAATACGDGEPAQLTYHRDVRPIIERSCVGCHAPDNIAPFALDSYAEVASRAAPIEAAIRSRAMPPSPVDVSGACQDFVDADYLTDAEIATIATWAAAGAIEGDPGEAPPPRPAPPALAFDRDLAPPAPYAPATVRSDDYRCFVLPALASEDRFVTAVEVTPGEPRVVHHVLLFANLEAAEDQAAAALDAADPGLGYTCFGNAGEGVGSTLVAVWTPGQDPQDFGSLGVRIPGGRSLVMQVHYNYTSGARPDLTRVRLRTAAAVDEELYMTLLDDGALVVPPGEPAAAYTWELPLADLAPAPLKLRFAGTHMHNYGRTARLELARANGTRECLVDTPRWDFHWQRLYQLARPPVLRPTDAVRMTCTYDTRDRVQPLRWGERTEDEMCMTFVGVTL